MSINPDSWAYEVRRCGGAANALKDYHPELAASDPLLNMAVNQIAVAELAIEARMAQLLKEQDE